MSTFQSFTSSKTFSYTESTFSLNESTFTRTETTKRTTLQTYSNNWKMSSSPSRTATTPKYFFQRYVTYAKSWQYDGFSTIQGSCRKIFYCQNKIDLQDSLQDYIPSDNLFTSSHSSPLHFDQIDRICPLRRIGSLTSLT